MSDDFSGLLNPITKIFDYLGEHPDVKEKRRNIVFILSTITVFLQTFIQVIAPDVSVTIRVGFVLVAYGIALVAALVIGEQIRLRRWLIYLSPLLIAPALASAIYLYSYNSNNAYRIAPSLVSIGRQLPYTTAYGTNARILEAQAYKSKESSAPDEFIRLKFQLFCQGTDEYCNAGWLMGNLRGIENPNQVQELVFDIRGAAGNEVVGVSMKDSSQTETRIFDVGNFISKGTGIETDWETARIPITEFGEVKLADLDLISFFVDARYTPYPIIDVDVGNVRLE